MMFQWRVIMDWCRSVYLAEKSKISTSLNKIKRLHLCMGMCVCVPFFVYVRMGDTDHHFIPSLSSDVSFWLHVLNEPDAVNYISILSPKSNAAE